MFLNPFYGNENPPSANGGVLNTSHSPLSSTSHSPHNSPTPHRRIGLSSSQGSHSPSPSPNLLPRNSHLHTHFSYLASPSSPHHHIHNTSSSNTNTSSSSNNSSPVLLRNNNSPSNSPRLSRNLNTFSTPHNLQHSSHSTSLSPLASNLPPPPPPPSASAVAAAAANALIHVNNSSTPSAVTNSSNTLNSSNSSSNSSTTSGGSCSSNSSTLSGQTLTNRCNTLPTPSAIERAAGIHYIHNHSQLFRSRSPSSSPSFSTSTTPRSHRASSLSKTLPLRPPPGTPSLQVLQSLLDELQMKLRPGWTVHCTTDGRYFYCNHGSGTSSWLPPLENWRCGGATLPYGWEEAVDKDGKTYFINHLNKTTTYSDPRKDDPLEDPPKPRTVTLSRDLEMGFGFVAGSEKPVIVRFVTDGGPSEDLLLPGDQILEINGEDVKKAPRDHVIQLVRSCKDSVTLTVTQPPLDNSARKSALLSAAKKQRLKNNPSRVRFAESVHINGTASNVQNAALSSAESTTPFMPNVLKVFLENGQTKSFKYDSSTTVGDVLESLHQKLGIKCPTYFSLVVEHVKSLRRNKLTILDPNETLSRIAARPGAQHLRCLYRVTFVPRDAFSMLRRDTVAFEYLYHQCCNDVLQERFSPELKCDVALRLAALHIQQHAITNGMSGSKINVKTIEREFGLEKFVPGSLLEGMKRKELRKLLSHFLKVQAGAAQSAGQKQVPALQPKLHYLKIIAELPSYGAKCFSGCVMEANQESVVLISPRFGISQITGIRNTMPEPLCDIDQMTGVLVSREEDNISLKVDISLKDPDKEKLCVTLEERDAEELVLVLQGYYCLLTEKSLPVEHTKDLNPTDQAPPYHAKHRVHASGWSYAATTQGCGPTGEIHERIVDLSAAPPYQKPPQGYKVPNGLIPGLNLNDSPSMTRSNQGSDLDTNMNKTNSVYDNSSDTGTLTRSDAAGEVRATGGGAVLGAPHTAASIGDMEGSSFADGSSGGAKKVHFSSLSDNGAVFEARNSGSEVIRRVADLQPDASDSEATDLESTDVESVRSDGRQYGRLKHSDSLLLLTQGQKLVADMEQQHPAIGALGSGSDTDSMSTPTHSPAHRPGLITVKQQQTQLSSVHSSIHSSNPHAVTSKSSSTATTTEAVNGGVGMKTNFSSFGLHSPDNLPSQSTHNDIKTIIKQLEDNSGLPYASAQGTLYLDPDIIDLTMIPPPITPDEDGAVKMLTVPQLNTPPTPFADRETLEKELQALEKHSASSLISGSLSDTIDTLSLSSLNTTISSDTTTTASSSLDTTPRSSGPGFTLAALKQLGIQVHADEDIDSFIANLTIPPPPEGATSYAEQIDVEAASIPEGATSYDLSAFIIPPPPASSGNSNRSSDIIRRLYEAKAGIIKVVGEDGSGESTDADTQKTCNTLPSGKVASLQKHFEPHKQTSTLNSKKSTYIFDSLPSHSANIPSDSSLSDSSQKSSIKHSPISPGYDNVQPDTSSELDARLAQAIEENDQIFRTFGTLGRARQADEKNEDNMENGDLPSVSARIKNFNSSIASQRFPTLPRQQSFPVTEKADSKPSPPPRVPVVNSSSYLSSTKSRTGNPHPISPKKIDSLSSLSSLSKSASHGDIASHGTCNSSQANESTSSEDLRLGKNSPSSPVKQSILSSNDSLTSSSSLVTVKSASLKSLDDEPPELPPRNMNKNAMKPPLPRSPSQESTRASPITKGLRSPSPRRRPTFQNGTGSSSTSPTSSSASSDVPPALPSRTKTSPQKLAPASPSRRLSSPGINKPPAPSPPSTSPSSSDVSMASDRSSPTKTNPFINRPLPPINNSPIANKNSILSQIHNGSRTGTDSITIKNNINEGLAPLQTSSPKISPKLKIQNGKLALGADLDDSLDSGSFDQDSLDESEEVEAMAPASREAFKQVTSVVAASIKSLTKMSAICAEAQKTGNIKKNEAKFQTAKDALTSESRQFVTASKLFVKSATESEDTLLQCLSNCVTLLQKMVDITDEVVQHTATPLQTQNVVVKVRDVSSSYHTTVRAALAASGRGLDHPSMSSLMTHATNLAGVLTSLMRTLRVFSP